MALSVRKIKYKRSGEVYEISTYTLASDVGTDKVAVAVNGEVVYAKAVPTSDPSKSHVCIRKNGTTLNVAKSATTQELLFTGSPVNTNIFEVSASTSTVFDTVDRYFPSSDTSVTISSGFRIQRGFLIGPNLYGIAGFTMYAHNGSAWNTITSNGRQIVVPSLLGIAALASDSVCMYGIFNTIGGVSPVQDSITGADPYGLVRTGTNGVWQTTTDWHSPARIRGVSVDSSENIVVVGDFTSIGSAFTTPRGVARYNGANWSTMGVTGYSGGLILGVLAVSSTEVYIWGTFTTLNTTAGSISTIGIARWNGTSWSNMGATFPVTTTGVRTVASAGAHIYMALNTYNSTSGNNGYIYKYVSATNTWTALASQKSGWLSYMDCSQNGNLYVYGGVSSTVSSTYFVRYVLSSNTWDTPAGASFINIRSIFACKHNNSVFITGAFDSVSSVTNTKNIAKFNGISTWSSIAASINAPATISGSRTSEGFVLTDNSLYEVNSVLCGGIARWTGTAWSNISSTSGVRSVIVAINNANTRVYAIGSKVGASIGGIIAHNIAGYNGTSFYALGSGVRNDAASSMVNDVHVVNQSDMYICGAFSKSGNSNISNNIARWNGSNITSLGGSAGADTQVHHIVRTSTDGAVYIAGNITSVDGVAINRLAKWNGSAWSQVLHPSGNVFAAGPIITDVGGKLGCFIQGTSTPKKAHIYNGTSWEDGEFSNNGPIDYFNNMIQKPLALPSGHIMWDILQVGNLGGNLGTHALGVWDGVNWKIPGEGTPFGARAAVVTLSALHDGSVLVTGRRETYSHVFTGAGRMGTDGSIDTSTYPIAIKQGTISAYIHIGSATGNEYIGISSPLNWGEYPSTVFIRSSGGHNSALRLPAPGTVRSIVEEGNGDLYIGGWFSNFLYKYDGSTFLRIGSAYPNSNVNSVVQYQGNIVIGGAFSSVGGVSAVGIAMWNGSAWQGFSANNIVEKLYVSKAGVLYACGQFTSIGGVACNRIARFNGTSWVAMSSGNTFNSTLLAIGEDSDGSILAGGQSSTPYIGKWNGSTWSNFVTTNPGTVFDIKTFNGYVYVASSSGLYRVIAGNLAHASDTHKVIGSVRSLAVRGS